MSRLNRPERPASVGAVLLLVAALAPIPAGALQRVADTAPDTAHVRRVLHDAVARAPEAVGPYLELAAFELSHGRERVAETVLRTGLEAASRHPDLGVLRRGLTELLGSQARWAEALDVVTDPEIEARLRVGAARAHRESGQATRAEADLRRAVALEPDFREAWLELAALLAQHERMDEARAAADRGLRAHPDDPELRLVRAATLDGPEHVTETVAALRVLRSRRPDDVALALSLAGYLSAAGDPTAAMALQDTLLADPRPAADVFRHVGRFWLTVGDADSASVHLERGTRVHPRDVTLHALLGLSREEAGHPEAPDAYGAAARLLEESADPRTSAWLRVRAARAAAARGRGTDPLSWIRPFTVADPLPAVLLSAELALELGRPGHARTTLDEAAPRWSGDPSFRETDARVALVLGDTTGAVRRYEALAREGNAAAFVALDGLARSGTTTSVPGDSAALRAAVRSGIDAVARVEEGMADAGAEGGRPLDGARLVEGGDLAAEWARRTLEARRSALGHVLSRMVFETAWGPAELARLRAAYPGSIYLAEMDIRLALRQGEATRALQEVERLLRLQPGRVDPHLLHGASLEAAGRGAEARASYGRAFEMDPGADAAFQGLLRLHRSDGSLDDLLGRVRRVRATAPDDAVLVTREVEVLQRLGRLQEARDLATQHGGGA